METHVRVLAILHIIFGALGVLGAIFLFALFGGITSLIGMNAPDEEALIAIPIVGGVGIFLVLVTLVLSVPSFIAGIGLLSHRPWSRILTLVLSVLELIHVPFGTALGFYGLWVLLSKEVVPMFERNVTYGYSGPRT